MHLSSILALLSIAALASAEKLRNTYNGLCLDAPEGAGMNVFLRMVPCDRLTNGNWIITSYGDRLSIKSTLDPDRPAQDGLTGWCLDINPPRLNRPTLWMCNRSAAQLFPRSPITRPGVLSFMSLFRDNDANYELSVNRDDGPGETVRFGPTRPDAIDKCYRFEWVAIP